MTIYHEDLFKLQQNQYRIFKLQHLAQPICLTLSREAWVEMDEAFFWLPFYSVEQGDIMWNTLTSSQYPSDAPRRPLAIISSAHVFEWLKILAHRFDRHYPEPLIFRNQKNLQQFVRKVHKQPVKLTSFGPVYPRLAAQGASCRLN